MSPEFIKSELDKVFTKHIKVKEVVLTKFGYYKFILTNNQKGKAEFKQGPKIWVIKWASGDLKGTIKPNE